MKSLAVDEKEFKNHDIHVHLPEGAIPKDGPSAGIAIYLAIASVITDRIVKPDIAMTGEIDLMGTVMKIGGLKEKLLAAQRCQVKTVIIPEGNMQDLTELPTELLQQLKIIGVKTAKQVLDLALEGREFEMIRETINIKQL
jgi:ATP-dependent Lon protease